ncbi:sensor histidine kinase [Paenibacillus arenilitoris]|uniref:histidine kinase n=1 Tax=Paenibacillus arenilitoris TaxID=2772299 RepID=A0A927CQB8_9BACL|nr:ATP-binding protein [Paenibacillus arenilitoris]MBD2871132.1 HAMP domain-containing protein [Paenibacillus arenilitoris]
MSVSRKLFLAMASFIVAMCFVFAFMTQLVLRDILEVMIGEMSQQDVGELTERLLQYYETNGQSWEGVDSLEVPDSAWKHHREASFILLSDGKQLLYRAGGEKEALVKRFGARTFIESGGNTVGWLYYYDPDIGYLSQLRYAVKNSVTVVLVMAAILFTIVSLLVAFWLSRRLTAPIRRLIPFLDRLGKGELGLQAPVEGKDEYGKITVAFNQMSKELHRTEEVRKNLVADVAHELRTPLTIIRGKLDLAQQSGQPVEPETLLPLQDELIRLTRLVDDLHQLSLAEARKLPLTLAPTSVPELLRRVVERIGPDAEDKQIAVRLSAEDEVPLIVADPNRLTQVFLNLLVNALRYTPSGGAIDIDVAALTDPGRAGKLLQVRIKDTGIGIPAEQLPYLFNRFYRTDEARARSSGGMGLGLAIAKEFVRAHNGTIEAESVVRHGTTFTVRLPV